MLRSRRVAAERRAADFRRTAPGGRLCRIGRVAEQDIVDGRPERCRYLEAPLKNHERLVIPGGHDDEAAAVRGACLPFAERSVARSDA